MTGCYAQLEPGQTAALGVDLVVGNQDKDRLAEVVQEHGLLVGAPKDEEIRAFDLHSSYLYPGAHTRAFIKVQDGCDNH